MRESTIEALILKHQPMGDAGLLVTVFSKEQGKMRLLVKGAQRMTSKLAAAVQPGGSSFLTYTGKGNLPLVIHAQQNIFYLNGVEDLAIISSWFVIAEWLLKTTVDEQPQPALFSVTDQALRQLPSTDTARVVLWWKVQLLDLLGWGIQVFTTDSVRVYFNFSEGSFVDVGRKSGDALLVSRRCVDTFELLSKVVASRLSDVSCAADALTELDMLATRYLTTIIERDLKADRFRQL